MFNDLDWMCGGLLTNCFTCWQMSVKYANAFDCLFHLHEFFSNRQYLNSSNRCIHLHNIPLSVWMVVHKYCWDVWILDIHHRRISSYFFPKLKVFGLLISVQQQAQCISCYVHSIFTFLLMNEWIYGHNSSSSFMHHQKTHANKKFNFENRKTNPL